MSDFVAPIKAIPYDTDRIYNLLSDLSNLEKVRNHIPEEKLKGFEFDQDSCRFSIDPVGMIEFKVIEREPSKTIKFATTNSPVPLLLWIQLKQVGEQDTRMKLTARAELNPFIKTMVEKPLQNALDKASELLATIPY